MAKRTVVRLLRQSFPRMAALLEFPAASTPRYGWGRPEYPQFRKLCEERRSSIEHLLTSFLPFKAQLLRIPRRSDSDGVDPAWENDMFPTLDALALYCMLSLYRPAQYLEIGAGHSTKFARRAIIDNALRTSITCIDPAPGVKIAQAADRVIGKPLQEIDLEVFKTLNPGDVLFVDGSHRVFMNSDVTVLFLDVLPTLKTGVIVHFHDIHLPYDYPPEWAHLYYNEQYLLAAYVLGGNRFQLLLPNAFVTRDAELHKILEPIWSAPTMAGLPAYGASLWGVIGEQNQKRGQ